MSDRDFPENFVWGAATCPACCEGETVSDWARLSASDGSVPDDGPRHWRRYRYDFRAMATLNLTAYRFGIDWGRLQREPYGEFGREDTLRYLEMLAELRGHGIEPYLTLFHNALPRWAAKAGGWLNPETPHWYADFVRRLAHITDGETRYWITVHEPQVYAFSCYAWDAFPGGEWGRLDHVKKALAHLRTGHCLAAQMIRKRLPGAQVGLALAGDALLPQRVWHPGDHVAARVSNWLLSRFGLGGFLKGDGKCDFLMLGTGRELRVNSWNALSLSSAVDKDIRLRMHREGGKNITASHRRSRLGAWLRRTGLPVYLVGGGDDVKALLAAFKGVEGGVAAGFFYDPLLDQFDLAGGLHSGGGLLRVDFHGQDRRREFRPSAHEYGRLARTGKL